MQDKLRYLVLTVDIGYLVVQDDNLLYSDILLYLGTEWSSLLIGYKLVNEYIRVPSGPFSNQGGTDTQIRPHLHQYHYSALTERQKQFQGLVAMGYLDYAQIDQITYS